MRRRRSSESSTRSILSRAPTRQVKIFQLRHIVPGPNLENMLATITEGDVRFAMDEAHKVVVATGTEQSLAVVEAFLNRMDTETAGASAAKPAAKEVQLRLVWLVGGLADDAAAVPPPDLEGCRAGVGEDWCDESDHGRSDRGQRHGGREVFRQRISQGE